MMIASSLRAASRSLSALDRQQLGQRADDAIGLDRGTRGQAYSVSIDPDGIEPKALRRFDFPFQIVTDHPGLGCGYPQRLHGVPVGALVRLAETMLALDLDMIEPVRQRKAFDLCALDSGCAVGYQRQFHAARSQGIDCVMRAREDEHLLLAIGSEAVGEPYRKIHRWGGVTGGGKRGKSAPDDFMPCFGEL